MSYTSTTIRVIADLTDAQARELVAPIEVTRSAARRHGDPGTIATVDPGGEPTANGDETTSASAIVEFADQAAVADVGLRSVKVVIARDEVADALVVPVTALIATLDDGYAVEVVRSGKIDARAGRARADRRHPGADHGRRPRRGRCRGGGGMSAAAPVIALDGVVKDYGNLRVLHGIDLTIARG